MLSLVWYYLLTCNARHRCRRSGLVRRFGDDGARNAEREERDRRRAEARRYPVDDAELLAELREHALHTGEDFFLPPLEP